MADTTHPHASVSAALGKDAPPGDAPAAQIHTGNVFKDLFNLFKQTIFELVDDKAFTYAASLAYYTVFSLAPTLVIALAIAGVVFGGKAAEGAMQAELEGIIGPSAAATVQEMMANAGKHGSGSGLAAVLGGILLAFAATAVFAELQNALNTIWKAKPKPINTVLAWLRTRFLSLAVVIGIGFLLMVSLVVSAGVTAVGSGIESAIPARGIVSQVLNMVVGIGVFALLFALIFKLLPDAKIQWRDVWFAAFVSSCMFNLGKYLISLYLTKAAVSSGYGAAGSLAALLVWVYYSSIITLGGAELAQVYMHSRGSGLKGPEKTPEKTPA